MDESESSGRNIFFCCVYLSDGDQRAFVPAVEADGDQEDDGDEDGDRYDPNEGGGVHDSSKPEEKQQVNGRFWVF